MSNVGLDTLFGVSLISRVDEADAALWGATRGALAADRAERPEPAVTRAVEVVDRARVRGGVRCRDSRARHASSAVPARIRGSRTSSSRTPRVSESRAARTWRRSTPAFSWRRASERAVVVRTSVSR